MQSHIPVVISGAGPTGLITAVQLQRYGIPFRIVDKQIKPVPTSNALAVQMRTMEIWDDLGILDEALALGNKLKGMNLFSKKHKLAHIDLDVLKISDYPFVLGLPQHDTETLLLNYLKKKDINVEMEVELTDFREEGDTISVTLTHKDGESETIKTDWLIACDGGHSIIREKLNMPFQGQELSQHFVLADLEIESNLQSDLLNIISSDQGPLLIIPYNKKFTRIIAEVSSDPELCEAKSLTFAQLKRLVAERCEFELKMKEPIWTSGFWIHERIISKYRHNRIFFAGDAAHVHSPAGGQGMNTGIQDAYNLGWKLALFIKGKVKSKILDTYNDERRPIGLGVLRDSTFLTKMISVHNPLLINLRNYLLSFIMKFNFARLQFAEKLTQLKIRYKENVLVRDCLGGHAGPKAGMRMLDVRISAPGIQNLFDIVRGTQFVLFFFSGSKNNFDLDQFSQLKKSLEAKYSDLIKFVLINAKNDFANWDGVKIFDENLRAHECYKVTEPSLYLIRPDKYVGFRGGIQDKNSLEEYFADLM